MAEPETHNAHTLCEKLSSAHLQDEQANDDTLITDQSLRMLYLIVTNLTDRLFTKVLILDDDLVQLHIVYTESY